MASSHILCDKTEIVLTYDTKEGYRTMSVPYDKIISITVGQTEVRKLFRKVTTDKIEFKLRNREEPIIYTRIDEKEHFDKYIEDISKFAKDNKITLHNNL